jgi:AcrR family transcriptional regulator
MPRHPAGPAPIPPDPDRTARARIRDAAIVRFAADGVAATNVKAIAADAGVSPPLVMHHFGSKDGLRVACDHYVVERIWALKREHLGKAPPSDPLAALRAGSHHLPLLAYLARTIPDGSPHVDGLIDEMVDETVAYLAAAEASGIVRPSDHPRERAVILVLWQLGAIVLHAHASRLLGADLIGEPEGALRWSLPAAEILAKGVITEDVYDRLHAAAGSNTTDDAPEPTGMTDAGSDA